MFDIYIELKFLAFSFQLLIFYPNRSIRCETLGMIDHFIHDLLFFDPSLSILKPDVVKCVTNKGSYV